MKKLLTIWLLGLATCRLTAQTATETALATIERNNTTLKALRLSADAEKQGNRAGNVLPDPEIGFNHLWGSEADMGTRRDLSVTQTFDFATLSGRKRRLAAAADRQTDRQLQADRLEIRREARLKLLEHTYFSLLQRQQRQRLAQAERLVSSRERLLAEGEGNRPELNYAKLELAGTQAALQRTGALLASTQADLQRLNGGIPLHFEAANFDNTPLPTDFDAWAADAIARNPALAHTQGNIEHSRERLSLVAAERMPALSLGYMSEKTPGQRYQGVSIGLNIPLWGNKRKLSQAKAEVVAAEALQADALQQFRGRLEALYTRARGLQTTARTLQTALNGLNSEEWLRKSLDAGEISVVEYISGLTLYYEAAERSLEAELEYRKAVAELLTIAD